VNYSAAYPQDGPAIRRIVDILGAAIDKGTGPATAETENAMRRGMIGLTLAAPMLWAATARADAIDGNWCFQAKQMSIRGPAIVTPGGTAMQGDYDRHGFVYVIPPGEPDAGQTVVMALLNETTLRLGTGSDVTAAAKAADQIWRRCSATTS
jgi:hypothetical protein